MSNQLVQIQLDRREAMGKIGGLLAAAIGLETGRSRYSRAATPAVA
jgi:hypothetical protein